MNATTYTSTVTSRIPTRFLASLALVFSAAALPASAHAQGFGPYYGGYYGYGGATPYSTYQHGFADIVRSAGVYNVLTSQAYSTLEDARKKNIDNRMHWAQTYFEMRKLNREYRKAEYDALYPPKTQEDFIRYAQARAPSRLRSTQLDPVTGYVAWPRLLLSDRYADLRRDLDRLFAERANAQGAIGNDSYYAILEKTEQMLERLKATVRVVPTNDYIQARNFLDSLAYEARFATSG